MKTYVILRRDGWRSPEELQAAAGRSTTVGDDEMSDDIRWIRSYVMAEPDDGRSRNGLHLPGHEPGEDSRARRSCRLAGDGDH